MKLRGDTGPLVYPAGFLYVYSAVQIITGGEVYPAQILFGVLYLINLGIVLAIYMKTDVLPWWAYCLLCLSKRVHSIFVLRLFNDCFAMTLLHAALAVLLYRKWHLALIIFSGAVSIKMNVLLYAPPLLLLMLKGLSMSGVITALSGAALLQLPWWAYCLLCLSKRVHSIFVLRLFNDCFAMTLLHAALAVLLYRKWHLALIIFSGAVSIKMNVLLYAPPLLLLMLKGLSMSGVITALSGAALLQIILGLPFLLSDPVGYISRAFNLGRVFIHFWSVNFKFVPEAIFVSKPFAIALLVVHLTLLLMFTHHKWCKHEGGLIHFLHTRFAHLKPSNIVQTFSSLRYFFAHDSAFGILREEHIATVMFVGNFIGIVCARSLHYQFYSWYFYSLPFLLWKTPFPNSLRVILFFTVEICWNIFPSNLYSSLALLCTHLLILWGLWITKCEYPYVHSKSRPTKKD
ncbi:Dol-P-Man:Man(5)GlcNAc(2)-PP-Dol alpha-1,3-mannosyltransferase [Acorus calamus]|uniref:dolichyl-P-Man:Man5GlcNAc2-PP-dolichol alpha-1,3-mannosyltransferase n=1 Tax=Acorus calamus TaxID=4465 RepID=A0AAV9CYM2_ACOCL|nr:Dol-P-Man:Man(5)GlcNAc(2)-PP-Dol alpha-1,3-mannosyltransferase [Acorus calamus]